MTRDFAYGSSRESGGLRLVGAYEIAFFAIGSNSGMNVGVTTGTIVDTYIPAC